MTENHFEIETESGVIRGMLHDPGNHHHPGVALFVHGYFSANRVGPARLYLEAARDLCRRGLKAYRPDCLGVGDSDGNFEDVSLASELRDFRAVVSHLAQVHRHKRIVIVAHSMGANLSLRIAPEFPEIASLILIAPDLVMRNNVDQLFTPEQAAELKTNGWTLRKGFRINNSFVQELRDMPAFDLARSLTIPLTVIQGSQDELYEKSGAERLAAVARTGRYIQIDGADHNFFLPPDRRRLFNAIWSAIP